MHSNERNGDLARNNSCNGFLAGFCMLLRHRLDDMHELGETEWQCCECAGSQPDCGRVCQVSERSVKAMLCNGQKYVLARFALGCHLKL